MRLLCCILLLLSLFGGCRQLPEAPQSSEAIISSPSSVSASVPQSSASAVVSKAPPVSAAASFASSEAVQASASAAAPAEENLRDLLWINFEKPLYGAETQWMYIWVNNKSDIPVYVMQTYALEKLTDEGWLQIGDEMSFDNPSLQVPVEPDESRLVGVFMGWLGVMFTLE